MTKRFIYIIAAFLMLVSCSTTNKYTALQNELTDFVKDKDARIGMAVIIDGKDTVAVNGKEDFPMLSVYKLPIALALADNYRVKGLDFSEPIAIAKEDLHLDTYSPMTGRLLASSVVSIDSLSMPTREILNYMLHQSDNNASDLAVKKLGGTENVMKWLSKSGLSGVKVVSTENEMHINPELSYKNSSTPIAMARLLDKLDTEWNDSLSKEIKQMMETCKTGENRLAKPLLPTNAVTGHKTGTGFPLPDGGIMAVNDVGYVHLSNGHRYSIAVFIADAHYDMAESENIIAQISEMVWRNIK
nr:classA [uncultured bacterium]